MPGSKSDYVENKILDHRYGGPDYVRPATVYVALFTVAPSDSGGGTECSGGVYARKAVTNNATNWPASSGSQKSNGTLIEFAQQTTNLGTVVAIGIFDAASGGNLLDWATLTNSRTYFAGDTPQLQPGDIVITED